jgi:hypothetical protein
MGVRLREDLFDHRLGFGAYWATQGLVYDRTMGLVSVNGTVDYGHHQSILYGNDIALSAPLWFLPPMFATFA